MTANIEKQILEISAMIDGVNIGIERAREIREKMLFEGIQETIGLDALLGVLRRDQKELEGSMKELRKGLG